MRALRVFAKFDVTALLEKVRTAFFETDEDTMLQEFDAFSYPAGQEPIFGISKPIMLKSDVWRSFNQQLEEMGLIWVSTSVKGTPATLCIGVYRYGKR
jgi:hypothetical protein